MDVHCCNCREPWDQYYLRHELDGEDDDVLSDEGWRFGPNRLVVIHCPCCPKDGAALPGNDTRESAVRGIAEALGDDLDGLAATLEDFDL